MTDNTQHHEKLDKMIDDARETMHQMMDNAIFADALSEDFINPNNYLLAKAIITIFGDQRNYASLDSTYRHDVENLSHTI